MIIAVSSTGQDLNSQVDPRFGRCQYFVFVDSDSMNFEAVVNPNISAAGGAGIQSAQLVANRGAEVVLTGNCGPNAYQTLSAAGIQLITGISGTVRDAVERFKSGQFQVASGANVPEYSGIGGGMGSGMGRGMAGGGMGMGRGMARGRGMGRGRMGGFGAGGMGTMAPGLPPLPPQQPGPPPPPPPNSSEIQALREQIDTLQKQVQQLTEKLTQAEESKSS